MPLDTYPLGLTNLIIAHLDKADLCALRLSCKTSHAKLQTTFAAFFQRLTVFSTRESLDRIEATASHNTFRLYVEEVALVADVFRGLYTTDFTTFSAAKRYKFPWQRAGIWSAEELKANYYAYQIVVAEHLSLISSDLLSQTLASCMSRFENLSAVWLRPYGESSPSLLHDTPGKPATRLGRRPLRD
ncbi:uncharacterized protein BDW70DRAFT_162910 [Aspergillus foveolatus]|uniref:uncharacterized protein n=1 Tax=Aspergillus foveolatus TaxID=210207 RepID=UPI003CCE407B